MQKEYSQTKKSVFTFVAAGAIWLAAGVLWASLGVDVAHAEVDEKLYPATTCRPVAPYTLYFGVSQGCIFTIIVTPIGLLWCVPLFGFD